MTNTMQKARRACIWLALAMAGAALVACSSPMEASVAGADRAAVQKCLAEGSTWDKDNVRITEGYCAKGTPAQCVAVGGQWQRVCMMGTLACVKPYADAGKVCSDGSQCAGRRCLMAPGASHHTVPQSGHCIANDNPCYFGINLQNGQPVPTAVAD